MKDIRIFVFSGTGNTMRIATLLKEALLAGGADVRLDSFEDGRESVRITEETVIICYPVHAFNAPGNVIRFCKSLPEGRANLYFVRTQGEPLRTNNNASRELIRAIRKKGYRYRGQFRYVMPYNIMFRHSDEIASKMLQTAKDRIPRAAGLIMAGKRHRLRMTLRARIVGRLFRFEHAAMRLNGRFYRVNAARCTACLECVEHCPVQNISFENGSFSFGRECVGCMHCAFQCKTDAIRIGLVDFMRVNGEYDFTRDPDKAVIGRYCHKSYARYFGEDEEEDESYE